MKRFYRMSSGWRSVSTSEKFSLQETTFQKKLQSRYNFSVSIKQHNLWWKDCIADANLNQFSRFYDGDHYMLPPKMIKMVVVMMMMMLIREGGGQRCLVKMVNKYFLTTVQFSEKIGRGLLSFASWFLCFLLHCWVCLLWLTYSSTISWGKCYPYIYLTLTGASF